jgi:hypothetical protein
MAHPPAKSDGVGEEVGVIAHQREQDHKKAPTRQDEGEQSPLMRIVKIEPRVRQHLPGPQAVSSSSFPEESVKEYKAAEGHETGDNHVSEDPDIGAGSFNAEIEGEQDHHQQDADGDGQAA